MRFKITEQARIDATVISIHGKLAAEGVRELETALAAAALPVCLDLKYLISADSNGIQAILSMSNKGVQLLNVSPYIKLLLELAPIADQKRAT